MGYYHDNQRINIDVNNKDEGNKPLSAKHHKKPTDNSRVQNVDKRPKNSQDPPVAQGQKPEMDRTEPPRKKSVEELIADMNTSLSTQIQSLKLELKADYNSIKLGYQKVQSDLVGITRDNSVLRKDVNDVRKDLQIANKKVSVLTGICARQERQLSEITRKMHASEAKLTKANLLIYGIKAIEGENPIEVVKKFFYQCHENHGGD